jgi:hypothetical protein
MKNSFMLLLVSFLFIAGCAPAIYSGPSGATFNDFAKVRHMCYTSLSKEASGYIDTYGGSYNEKVNCGAFASCLASHGYMKDPNGSFDAQGIRISCSP